MPRLVRALLVADLLIALGCSTPPWRREVIYSATGVALYRECLQENGQKVPLGLKQPVVLPVDRMQAILTQMKYVDDPLLGAAKELEVFSAKEAQDLALPLTLALKEASADERIRFLVTRSNWAALLTAPTGTSGVVFSRREGVLEIAVDYLQAGLIGAEDGNPARIVFREDPTESSSAQPLVPGPGTKLRTNDKGEVCSWWLEVNVAEVPPLPPEALAGAASRKPGSPGVTPGERLGGPASAAPSSAGDDAHYRDVRRRVETLNKLRADGMVSQEEYEKQLQAIVSEQPK